MSKRYTYETTVQLGSDESGEFDVKVSFCVAWGSPESGRFGAPEDYDPGSASEVEDIKVETVQGLTKGWDERFAFGFQTDAQIADAMIAALAEDDLLASAREEEADAAVRADEDRAERRREDAREGW